MTFSDHVAHAVGAGSIAAIAAIGVYSTRSIGRDLIESHERIAEVWCAMVERIAERWHAVAVLFPVTGAASSDRQAEEPR
ncbi:hypothetical protein [Sphingomonas yabuuchiae]|uniref:ABC-type phosphate/phosphonate transport system permease subunit n=1 Tax=Sphingomonas yabuuchiae TaxID=172044 RepID=A0AA40ZW21_9SPHN|nr:hypothetical protein [Sphingomonas yabuuchiae]MBB4611747.1 ABC-type phosphate/phosphonate transport system permease subunit [Sphingomonas yabuuchiae]MBN3556667.1 hypothetical protein [Sphingomonas yabuuchiae]